jgi:iron(III) transport system ATP-binding protein
MVPELICDKLKLSDVQLSYQGKPVLNGLSLTVKPNEILCLLGPSGCGKTTALKAIAGLLPTSDGEIQIDKTRVNGKGVFVPPESRNLGMIFQDYALFPHLSVAANVGFGIRKMAKSALADRVNELLTLVKLEGLGDRFPHQLSGGQQQRVAIARAIAYSPQLLLLDEPFSNIDTQVRYSLIAEIRAILKSQKMSAIFVTHSKEEGFAFADQMAIMDNGRIAQQDEPEIVFNHPKTPFVAEFLGKGLYLPAKVLSDNQVESGLGIVRSTSTVNLLVGTKGELFVRPQYFELNESNSPNAKIMHKTFGGSGFNYQIAYESMLIDVFSVHHWPVSAEVQLSLLSHDLHLFSR